MKKLLFIMLLPIAAKALSISQYKVMDIIEEVAPKYTRYKSTIKAICLTESSGGVQVLGDDGNSLGIMQIQYDTVMYVASFDKSLSYLKRLPRKNVETILLKNDRLSIRIASTLFQHYVEHYGYKEAVSRYNGGKRNLRYYRRVQKSLRVINGI
jgi:hypothetical protein